MSMIDVSIIIVNYNGANYLPECLDSVLSSQGNFSKEIIVIDNHSQDDSLTVLAPYQNQILLIKNTVNQGFAFANNQGLAKAKGTYTFLLNNDAVLYPDSLNIMLNFFKSHPETGLLAPKLLNADGSLQCPGSVIGHFLFKTDEPRKLKFVSGAALLIKTHVFKDIGGFDENFFFYNEDIDLCKQILKKGLDIYYVPAAQVKHYGGQATASRKPNSIIEGYRGGLYLAYKHYPAIIFHVYRVILLIDLLPRIIWYTGKSLFDNDAAPLRNAYLKILKIDFTSAIFLTRSSADKRNIIYD
ncbi:glycosyltransferase family 2 protein [Thermoproteota archaeon]